MLSYIFVGLWVVGALVVVLGTIRWLYLLKKLLGLVFKMAVGGVVLTALSFSLALTASTVW